MATVTPAARDAGEVFLDARGADRALRVSWHGEADVVVLSLWRGGACTGHVPAAGRGGARPDRRAPRRAGRSYDVHRARSGSTARAGYGRPSPAGAR